MMTFMDLTQLLQQCIKLSSQIQETLDQKVFKEIKGKFLQNSISMTLASNQKFAHSLTYFVYLSIKAGFYDIDLSTFFLEQLKNLENLNQLEMESLVMVISSLSTLQSLPNKNKDRTFLNQIAQEQQKRVMIQGFYNKNNEIKEYLQKEVSLGERIVKLTLMTKAVTHNKEFDATIFEPYGKDLLKNIIQIGKEQLNSFLEEPDSSNLNLITSANFLQVLCFNIHPTQINDQYSQSLTKLDQHDDSSIYNLILETLIILLQGEFSKNQRNQLMITLYSLKAYAQFEQARLQMIAQDNQIMVTTVVIENELLKQCYISFILQVMNNVEKIISESETDFIRIMFELCQKKILPAYFIKDPKIQEYINQLDLKKLSLRNRQDFFCLGHILSNSLIFTNFDHSIVEKYKQQLSETVKSLRPDQGLMQEINSQKLMAEIHASTDKEKVEKQELFHALKILGKFDRKEDFQAQKEKDQTVRNKFDNYNTHKNSQIKYQTDGMSKQNVQFREQNSQQQFDYNKQSTIQSNEPKISSLFKKSKGNQSQYNKSKNRSQNNNNTEFD
ncbi:UNKNOWN [Stylonychia lemnae]|uniref:Uncharacterized protein n=1 Tax=Stylonychia lemnae TaxID=5949 RepID=A0A078B9Y8_STYLE|nr:UNKNOWN [Stylonychia lemnae]|eukprot:CDW90363.1 UNKNOWN [Stylonychia lemnae]